MECIRKLCDALDTDFDDRVGIETDSHFLLEKFDLGFGVAGGAQHHGGGAGGG